MSRRTRRVPLHPGLESLETRQMLHGAPTSEPRAMALKLVEQDIAATQHHHAQMAQAAQRAAHERALHAQALHGQNHAHKPTVHTEVIGTHKVKSAQHKAKHHTAHHKAKHHKAVTTPVAATTTVLATPTAAATFPNTSVMATAAPVTATPSAPVSMTTATSVVTTTTPPAATTTAPTTGLAVGGDLDTTVVPGGITGPGVTYLITPQPLPANMTFNRATGELTFQPAPGQQGQYQFTITAQGGATSASEVVPISVAPANQATTEVSGTVVDENGLPLAGMPVAIGTSTATTNALGQFTLTGLPTDPGPISAGGQVATAQSRQGLMAPVSQLLGHDLYANADNILPQGLILPTINWSTPATFSQSSSTTTPLAVANPTMPGFAIQLPATAAGTAPSSGTIRVARLSPAVAAQHMPQGVGGEMLMYNAVGLNVSQPVMLSLPNDARLAPGSIVSLSLFNMTTGGHDPVGLMVVSPDGKTMTSTAPVQLGSATGTSGNTTQASPAAQPAVIQSGSSVTPTSGSGSGSASSSGSGTGSGSGVSPTSGSGSGGATGSPNNTVQCIIIQPQAPAGNSDNSCDGCQGTAGGTAPMDSDAGMDTGDYYLDHQQVTYESQGQAHGIDLQYNSSQADPNPIAQFQFTTPIGGDSSSITSVTAQVSLGGVIQGSPTTYNTPGGLVDDSTYNIPLQINGAALATGAYQYKMKVTENFGSGSNPGSGSGSSSGSSSGSGTTIAITSIFQGEVNVVNAASDSYGAGWSVGGLQQIAQPTAGGPAVVTAGQQGTERFDSVYSQGQAYLQDLAISPTTGTPETLTNDSTGNFTGTIPASSGSTTVGTVTGDFNGDGHPDLAVVGASSLSIELNNGSGGYSTSSTYTLPSGDTVKAVAVGNFAGHSNGTLDVAVLMATSYGSGVGYAVAVYVGNGNGTFTGPVITTIANGYNENYTNDSITAADFNGDGKTDLAFVTDDGVVDVFTASSGGAFTTSTLTLPSGHTATGVLADDYNGDGHPDLIVNAANQNETDPAGDFDVVDLYTNNGSGSFSLTSSDQTTAHNDPALTGLVAGAFNGSLVGPEIALAVLGDQAEFVDVIPLASNGTWGSGVLSQVTSQIPGTTGGSIVAADLNGAGRPSIALTDGTTSIHLLLADPGSNQFLPANTITLASGSASASGSGSGGVSFSTNLGQLVVAPFDGHTATPGLRGPSSDSSSLVQNGNGTWTRSYPDGTVLQFNSAGQEISQTDRNGNTTSYSYVPSGQAGAGALLSITDPVGLVTTLAYDANGHLASLTDPAGRVTAISVDGNDNLAQITNPDGAVEKYGYSTPSNHLATSETDPDGNTATAHYNALGVFTSETLPDGTSTTNVIGAEDLDLLAPGGTGPLSSQHAGSVTDPDGHTTTITYNSVGLPTAMTYANGNTSTTVYNSQGRPVVATDAMNRTTTTNYFSNNYVSSVTEPSVAYSTGMGGGSGSSSGSYSPPQTQTFKYSSSLAIPTSITDFMGRTTTLSLDSHGNVLKLTEPDGLSESWTYNAAGQVLTDTSRAGNTTTYTYDQYGRLTGVTEPGPSSSGSGSPQITLAYNAAGDVIAETDARGYTTTTIYDQAGRVLSTQDPTQAADGTKVQYSYDADGNLLSMTSANGGVTSYTYNKRDEVVTMTDPVHQGTNTHKSYNYDADGNLLSVTDMRGETTTYTYDNDNRTTSVTDGAGDKTTSTLDSDGEVTGTTDARGNTTTQSYDARGNLVSVTLPGYADPTGAGGSTSSFNQTYNGVGTFNYSYDPDGELAEEVDALGHASYWTYNSLGQQVTATDALGHTTTTTHDADGSVATTTDALGHTTTYTYDARDRLVSETDPSGGGTTTYTYDDDNNLTSVTDPDGNVTRYTYDADDRRATMTSPTGGLTTYTYDDDNNLIQTTDPDNRTIQYTYDKDDRETAENWVPVGGGSPTYTMTLTYDAVGNVAAVQDNFSEYTYNYDAANRVTGVSNAGTPGSPQVSLTYGYDADGDRTSLSDSLGGQYAYSYDQRDQLDSLMQSGSGSSGVASELALLQYNQDGNLTGLGRFADTAAHTTVAQTTYTYDAADRLTGITHANASGSTIASHAYTLDAADRLTSEIHTWNGGSTTDTTTYGYTNNDQLTTLTHSNSSFSNESFSYDSNGNRNASGQTTATGNEIQSDGTYNYAYDAAGNLVSKTSIATGVQTVYKWDDRNRLVEVDSVAGGTTTVLAKFTYDALNNQIEEVDNPNGSATTRWTVYDAKTPLLDFNGSGQQTARHLSVPGAIDELLARQTSSGVAWYLDDREGSVGDLINNTGMVLDHIDYTAYGQIAAESAPASGDRFKYAGMEYDAAIGLNYDRSRYYDTFTGRFLNLDPLGFRANDANEYRYTSNDPSNMNDTSGLLGIFFDGAGQTYGNNTIIQYMSNHYAGESFLFADVAWVSWAGWLPNGLGGYGFSSNDRLYLDQAETMAILTYNTNHCNPIDIFGWSRGGYLALRLAQRLNRDHIPVRVLELLDPVEGPYDSGAVNFIPPNVSHTWLGLDTAGFTEDYYGFFSFFMGDYVFIDMNIYTKTLDPRNNQVETYLIPHEKIGSANRTGVLSDMMNFAAKWGVKWK